jgi:hypothetical protein
LQNTGGVHPNPCSFRRSAPKFNLISFRITFFAHPSPLTPIKSTSYEKQWWGGPQGRRPSCPIHSLQVRKRDALSARRFLHRLLRHKRGDSETRL